MGSVRIDDAAVLVRRTWLVGALAAWAVACIPAAILLGSNGLALGILPLTLVTAALGLAIRRWPHRWKGTVTVEGDAVAIDGRVIATRKEMTNGISSTRDGRGLVRLSRGWAGIDVDVEVDSEAKAKALLEGLRLDRAHRTSRLVGAAGTSRQAGWTAAIATVALAALGILPVFIGVVGLVGTAIALLAAIVLAVRSFVTLTVGADGLLVERALAKERFIPFTDIDAVRSTNDVLEIVTKDGFPPVQIHLGGLGRFDRAVHGDENAFRLRAFTERVSEAMGDGSNAAAFAPEQLARGGRSVSSWLRDLRGESRTAFRDNAVPTEVLLGIVENAAALPTARAGAAVALGTRPELRPRLRVAAEACASPALRVALTAAAEAGDADSWDDRLADALERIDDEPRARARVLPASRH